MKFDNISATARIAVKHANRPLLVSIYVAALLLCTFNLFALVSHLNIGSNVWVSAFSYIPPIWLAVLSIVCMFGLMFFKRVKAAAVVFGFSIVLLTAAGDYSFAFMQNTGRPGAAAANGFSVAAFNVQVYSQGIEAVAAAIKSVDADVALLSENVIKPGKEREIQKAIYPYTLYQSGQNETAVASKLPVLAFKEIMLPSHQPSLSRYNELDRQTERAKRSFVHARVDVNGTVVNVLSVRFVAGRAGSRGLVDNLQWGKYLLKTQLEELNVFLDYVSRLQGPVVFGGDLNAPPSSILLQKIKNVATDAYLQKHFWGNLTYMMQVFPFQKRKDFPVNRLDYIFYKNGIRPLKAEIKKKVVYFSDHRPIFVKFAVPAYRG